MNELRNSTINIVASLRLLSPFQLTFKKILNHFHCDRYFSINTKFGLHFICFMLVQNNDEISPCDMVITDTNSKKNPLCSVSVLDFQLEKVSVLDLFCACINL